MTLAVLARKLRRGRLLELCIHRGPRDLPKAERGCWKRTAHPLRLCGDHRPTGAWP